jgi:hypothetical protein
MIAPTTSKPVSRTWLMPASIAGLIVVGLVAWLVLGGRTREPRLNEPTHVLAKFVSTRAFDKLPYEKQRLFYKMLDDRGNKEIEHAFRSGQLSDGEYRTALDSAWLGKHINRVEKYMALPPGSARAQYIDQLLVKKLKKDVEKEGDDAGEDIDADETAAELEVETWPAEVRQQWKQFHDTYRRERKAREAAATRPLAP